MTVAERVRRDEAGVPTVTLSAKEGRINADFSVGADPDDALPLRANERISSRGVSLHGAGFIVTPAQAATLGQAQRGADGRCSA